MGRTIMAKVLENDIRVIADEYFFDDAQSFFRNYSNRNEKQIAEDRFFEMLRDYGMLTKEMDYIVSLNRRYPYIYVVIDVDEFLKVNKNLLNNISIMFTDKDCKYILELLQ